MRHVGVDDSFRDGMLVGRTRGERKGLDVGVEGGPRQFAAVYEEYFEFVWRTARRLGVRPDAVDDVVQETFLVVHRRLSEPRSSSLRTWLYGVTVLTVRNHRRSLRRKSPHLQAGPVDPDRLPSAALGPDVSARKAEAARALEAILDGLDDDKRTVFVLVELEQLTVPEVAQIVEANANTVYSRLRLAREEFDAAVRRYRARNDT